MSLVHEGDASPPEWTTACPDWESRIMAGRSLITSPPLFPDEAQASLDVFSELRLMDTAGTPTMREASRQWVIDFVSAIFGAYDSGSGRRLITEFFLLISKKNGKSSTAAGIMLTALIRNWRHSAEFLILAPTIEIANNSFFPARDMVRADPELTALLHVQDHYRTITHRQTHAVLKIVAADNDTVGGKKATGVLVDELWLFGKKPNAENMLREACGGLASRPEGFTILLSTQSDEPPAGIFKQKLDYARGVRDGRINDPCFLPVIYEFPKHVIKEDKHKEEAFFHITNPNLGASVDEAFISRQFRMASEAGPESLRGFLSKHLNVEISTALRSDRWAGADFWDACGIEHLELDDILTRCEVIVAGVDGGGLDDMLGLAILGREAETRNWLIWTHAWVHPIAIERRKAEAARYHDFSRDGDLTIVEDVGKDIDDVADIIEQCEESGLLDRIGVDPVGIGDIVDALLERGISNERIVGISQGWRMTGAIKTAERRLAERGMIHGAQGLMTWCVGNAKQEPRGNAVLITKQISGSGKIDPLMALFNAVALMAMNPEPKGGPANPEIFFL